MADRLSVDFSWTPVDPSPLTWTVGGNTYPYTQQQDAIVRASDARYSSSLTKTNTALTFTASVIAPSTLTPIDYRWNFGDGMFAYGPTATHTYVAAAPQTAVSLIVTDQNLVQYTRQKLLNLRTGDRVALGMPWHA